MKVIEYFVGFQKRSIAVLTGPPFNGGGLPGNGRAVGQVHANAQDARAEGHKIIQDYEHADHYGNMGVFIGVTEVEGGYRAVINTYHSNT